MLGRHIVKVATLQSLLQGKRIMHSLLIRSQDYNFRFRLVNREIPPIVGFRWGKIAISLLHLEAHELQQKTRRQRLRIKQKAIVNNALCRGLTVLPAATERWSFLNMLEQKSTIFSREATIKLK